MSIVNFSIPKTLEQRIVMTMKHRGFTSKAEFFRFAAMDYIDFLNRSKSTVSKTNKKKTKS